MSILEFNNAVAMNSGSLMGFAVKFTKDTEDARDLLQDTILKALRYKDNFEEGTNINGWLYTIMRNIFINNYKQKIFRNTFVDRTDEGFFINSFSVNGLDSISDQINCNDIMAEINSLREEYREPFKMFIDGYHYDQIAEIMSIPVGTVKSRIFHARRKLMVVLKDFSRVNDKRSVTIEPA